MLSQRECVSHCEDITNEHSSLLLLLVDSEGRGHVGLNMLPWREGDSLDDLVTAMVAGASGINSDLP